MGFLENEKKRGEIVWITDKNCVTLQAITKWTKSKNIMEKSLLDWIPKAGGHMNLYCNEWVNGKEGTISDYSGHSVYRFYPMTVDPNDGHLITDTTNNPIVATGIVGYWLHFRKSANRLATMFQPDQKNIIEMFATYTEDKFAQYKDSFCDHPSLWRRNLEREFYVDFIIPNELKLNKQTEALFEYITPNDCLIVKEVMDEFIDYLKYKRTEMGYVDHPQLKVLRYLDSGDKFVLEDMPDYEFNTICDELEKGGYIKVYWVEGHVPEDVKLLDKGKAYMKLMEKGGTEKKEQETIVQHTESNCSEVNDEYQFLDTIENKPILALVWKLMQLDGALIKERGDKVVVQKILELITDLPYNSCKKVWEVGNRPITRKAEDIAKLNQLMKSIGMNIQL